MRDFSSKAFQNTQQFIGFTESRLIFKNAPSKSSTPSAGADQQKQSIAAIKAQEKILSDYYKKNPSKLKGLNLFIEKRTRGGIVRYKDNPFASIDNLAQKIFLGTGGNLQRIAAKDMKVAVHQYFIDNAISQDQATKTLKKCVRLKLKNGSLLFQDKDGEDLYEIPAKSKLRAQFEEKRKTVMAKTKNQRTTIQKSTPNPKLVANTPHTTVQQTQTVDTQPTIDTAKFNRAKNKATAIFNKLLSKLPNPSQFKIKFTKEGNNRFNIAVLDQQNQPVTQLSTSASEFLNAQSPYGYKQFSKNLSQAIKQRTASEKLVAKNQKYVKFNTTTKTYTVKFTKKRGKREVRDYSAERRLQIQHLFQFTDGQEATLTHRGKNYPIIWRNGTFRHKKTLRRALIRHNNTVKLIAEKQQKNLDNTGLLARKVFAKATTLTNIATTIFKKRPALMRQQGITSAATYAQTLKNANPNLTNGQVPAGTTVNIPFPQKNNQENLDSYKRQADKLRQTQAQKDQAQLKKDSAKLLNNPYSKNWEKTLKALKSRIKGNTLFKIQDKKLARLIRNHAAFNDAYDRGAIRGLNQIKQALMAAPFNLPQSQVPVFIYKMLVATRKSGATRNRNAIHINSLIASYPAFQRKFGIRNLQQLMRKRASIRGYLLNYPPKKIKKMLAEIKQAKKIIEEAKTALKSATGPQDTAKHQQKILVNQIKITNHLNTFKALKRSKRFLQGIDPFLARAMQVMQTFKAMYYQEPQKAHPSDNHPVLKKAQVTNDSPPAGTKFHSLDAIIKQSPRQRLGFNFDSRTETEGIAIPKSAVDAFNKAIHDQIKTSSTIYEGKFSSDQMKKMFTGSSMIRAIILEYGLKGAIDKGIIKRIKNQTSYVIDPKQIPKDFATNIATKLNKFYKGLNNPQTKSRFKGLQDNTEFMLALSNDNRYRQAAVIAKIFGTGRGAKRQLDLLKKFKLWTQGLDTRERPLTMKDIGRSRVKGSTLYKEYTSPEAAFVRMYNLLRQKGWTAFTVEINGYIDRYIASTAPNGAAYKKVQEWKQKNKNGQTPHPFHLTAQQLKSGNIKPSVIKYIRTGFVANEKYKESKETVSLQEEIRKRKKDPFYRKLFQLGVHEQFTVQDIRKWPLTLATGISFRVHVDLTNPLNSRFAGRIHLGKGIEVGISGTIPLRKNTGNRTYIPIIGPQIKANLWVKRSKNKQHTGKFATVIGLDEQKVIGSYTFSSKPNQQGDRGFAKLKFQAGNSLHEGLFAQLDVRGGWKSNTEIRAQQHLSQAIKNKNLSYMVRAVQALRGRIKKIDAQRMLVFLQDNPTIKSMINDLKTNSLETDPRVIVRYIISVYGAHIRRLTAAGYKTAGLNKIGAFGSARASAISTRIGGGLFLGFNTGNGTLVIVPHLTPRSRFLTGRHGQSLMDNRVLYQTIKRQLAAKGIRKKFIIAPSMDGFKTGAVIRDSLGRRTMLLDKKASLPSRATTNIDRISQNLQKLGINTEIQTEGPFKGMIKISPQRQRATHISMHIDRAMKKSGLIMHKGDIYLSLAKAKRLEIRRFQVNYPRRNQGAVQHIKYVISNNPYRTATDIMKNEVFHVMWRSGQKATLEQGGGYHSFDHTKEDHNCIEVAYGSQKRIITRIIKQKEKYDPNTGTMTITPEKTETQTISETNPMLARFSRMTVRSQEQKTQLTKQYREYLRERRTMPRITNPEFARLKVRRNKLKSVIKKILTQKKYAKISDQYKQLSTLAITARNKHDRVKLAQQLSKFITQIDPSIKNLNIAELSYVMLKLAANSFVNAKWVDQWLQKGLKLSQTARAKLMKGAFWKQTVAPAIKDMVDRKLLSSNSANALRQLRKPQLSQQLAKAIRERIFNRHMKVTTSVVAEIVQDFATNGKLKLQTTGSPAEQKQKLRQFMRNILLKVDFNNPGSSKRFRTSRGWKFYSATNSKFKTQKGKSRGLRYAQLYGQEKDYKLLGAKRLSLTAKGPEGDLAKTMFAAYSPYPKNPKQNLVAMAKSPLAFKAAYLPHLADMVGSGLATKMLQVAKNPQLANNSSHKAAAQKLADLSQKIRDTLLNKRGNTLIYNNHAIVIDAKVYFGAYNRCTNPTFAMRLRIGSVPLQTLKRYIMTSSKQVIRQRNVSAKQYLKLGLEAGVFASIPWGVTTKIPEKKRVLDNLGDLGV